MKIALIGNPNSGKSTFFNLATGNNAQTGNWAGVTVEKKVGTVKKGLSEEVSIVDLPGAYSMSPYTSEESITKNFILDENPDVIINIVDATNLSRSLFLTTQLLELGIPTVVALNKSDLTTKKGNSIDIDRLRKVLNTPIIEVSATKNNGLPELFTAVKTVAAQKKATKPLTIDGVYRSSKNKKESEKSDKKRFEYIEKVIASVESKKTKSHTQTKQDKIDRVVAHKWFGIPIFIAVIWLVFSISQAWVGPWLADLFVGWIDMFNEFAGGLLGEDVHPLVSAILLDGIIGGVGAVIGFLPLIMVLFFCLALLEESGYMARIAVIMDRFLKKVGLSGKSIIPMVIGTGCAIPGVMATRTIKSERQRRTTAMLTPFMPCGAKLPIIALFAGVFFGEQGWVGTLMYFLGIAVIIIGALIIRKITGDTSKSYFIMELPEYRIPNVLHALRSMLRQGKLFVVKAATIILICNAVVQILQTFTPSFAVTEVASESILAMVASPLAILFVPLGFGIWQFAAAAITGFIAKENVVGTLAVAFSITNFIDVEELALIEGATDVASVMGITSVAALSYLVFNLFTPPCFAAIGAMNAELESKKWLWGAIAFQFGVGYVLAFFIYQIGTLITTGALGSGFIGGLIAVACIIGFIIYLMNRDNGLTTNE